VNVIIDYKNRQFIICFILSCIIHLLFGIFLYNNFKESSKKNNALSGNESKIPLIVDPVPANRENYVITPADHKKNKKSKNSNLYQKDVHTVKPGESYWVIAKKYQITIEELLDYNRLSTTHVLKVGETLKIPRK